MNNPFDLKNYKPQVSYDDLERSRRTAYQATHAVNKARKNGVEPSKPYTEKDLPFGKTPETMTIDMPDLPVHKRTAQKRRKND
jgi:hypothetical protein